MVDGVGDQRAAGAHALERVLKVSLSAREAGVRINPGA
jgi:hypothetical protein